MVIWRVTGQRSAVGAIAGIRFKIAGSAPGGRLSRRAWRPGGSGYSDVMGPLPRAACHQRMRIAKSAPGVAAVATLHVTACSGTETDNIVMMTLAAHICD